MNRVFSTTSPLVAGKMINSGMSVRIRVIGEKTGQCKGQFISWEEAAKYDFGCNGHHPVHINHVDNLLHYRSRWQINGMPPRLYGEVFSRMGARIVGYNWNDREVEYESPISYDDSDKDWISKKHPFMFEGYL